MHLSNLKFAASARMEHVLATEERGGLELQ